MTMAPAARFHRVEHKRPIDFHPITRLQDMERRTNSTVHPYRRSFPPELRVIIEKSTAQYCLQDCGTRRQRHLAPPHGLGLCVDDFYLHEIKLFTPHRRPVRAV